MTKYQGGINKQVANILRAKTHKLLSNLHASNVLNEKIVNIITDTMGINAKAICEREGITYNIN